MIRLILVVITAALFLESCKEGTSSSLSEIGSEMPAIEGKSEYLDSPYVTAGDRVYMVGHQDGSFPEIGWHISGEMGGVWNHPIKLLDGFEAELIWEDKTEVLSKANRFTNYPMANSHQYTLGDKNMEVERWQFAPDEKQAVVVQYIFRNKAMEAQNFKFRFTSHSDLRPTWLGERTQMMDGTDKAKFDEKLDAWVIKDSLNDWFVSFGSDMTSVGNSKSNYDYNGLGLARSLDYDISIPVDESTIINMVIAGSYNSEEEMANTHSEVLENSNSLFTVKMGRYRDLASKSKLTVPDETLEQTFEWLKYNSDWLVRTVPEIGRGITAGMPDYPWWFGVDSEYALKGYMAIGQTEAVHNTIHLLDSLSAATNGNGRIVHEVSTNGAVFNEGNINETPQFASLIWEIYQWNGDREFLEKYYQTIEKGMKWLMEERDKDKNLFPDGFGMMEIHGLDSEMIDVAAYTQRAFEDAANIARELGKDEQAIAYSITASELKEKINNEFWSEEFASYADFIGTDEQALHLIEDAIVRADTLNKPWAVEELENTKAAILANPSGEPRPWVLHHNWVVNTPMEMGIADKDKAMKALNTAESFVNPFGVFVTGIDRDESAGSDDGSFQGSKQFSYTGAVMTLPTGVQAVAENNYGRPDKALNYLNRMSRSFSYALPGSMYEVSPDYGMMVQAWNIYSYAVPIVQQFFGIQPRAANKEVWIQPQMPEAWNEASLENVIMADNSISIHYSNKDAQITFKVLQYNPDWTAHIAFPKPSASMGYEVLQSPVEAREDGDHWVFTTNGEEIEIILKLN